MKQLIIQGGSKLCGEINISGMKNSALPIIFACILVKDDCILENIPRVSDVENSLEILRQMGAKAEFIDKNTVLINTKDISKSICGYNLISKMRASSYLMGAMLGRFNRACLPMPGGCNFGTRPIDLHLKGFKALGAEFTFDGSYASIFAPNGLKACKITLDKISVGATINMVLASVLTNGTTIIENSALEPHVDDVIQFLNKCGARITRKGNSIISDGVTSLHGITFRISPDMIEALTYVTFLGITGGDVLLRGIDYSHIKSTCNVFEKMGFDFTPRNSELRVKISQIPNGLSVVTSPYPGFPTDLHPQFSSLLCYTKSGGEVRDEVFPTRFKYASELEKMGAELSIVGNIVRILPSKLHGAVTDATDLRAGAALIGAGLGCPDVTIINNVNYIVRGYECLVDKLSSIGGKIKLIQGETKNGCN